MSLKAERVSTSRATPGSFRKCATSGQSTSRCCRSPAGGPASARAISTQPAQPRRFAFSIRRRRCRSTGERSGGFSRSGRATAPLANSSGSPVRWLRRSTSVCSRSARRSHSRRSADEARRVRRKTVCAAGPRCSPPGTVLSRAHIYGYGRSLRPPQGTTITPRRRATFRQALLVLSRSSMFQLQTGGERCLGDLELLGTWILGRKPVLELVTRLREGARERAVRVADHPAEQLCGDT